MEEKVEHSSTLVGKDLSSSLANKHSKNPAKSTYSRSTSYDKPSGGDSASKPLIVRQSLGGQRSRELSNPASSKKSSYSTQKHDLNDKTKNVTESSSRRVEKLNPYSKASSASASSGASSGTKMVPLHGGAGGPNMDMLMKMTAMFANKGQPDMSAVPAVPDSKSMKDKGGMPDFMSMMKKGSMPDLMNMMSQGAMMPDMFDMKDILSKMEGAGGMMGMMEMLDSIIEDSLQKPDSDDSEEEEGSSTIEFPCQYCPRLFNSSMSLKTHIMISHEREDESELNLKKRNTYDKSKYESLKQKHSRDHKGASSSIKSAEFSKAHTVKTDPSAAVPGVQYSKRSKSGQSGPSAADTSGAAGTSEIHSDESSSQNLASDGTEDPPDSRKRKALMQMQRNISGESITVVISSGKKVKAVGDKIPSSVGDRDWTKGVVTDLKVKASATKEACVTPSLSSQKESTSGVKQKKKLEVQEASPLKNRILPPKKNSYVIAELETGAGQSSTQPKISENNKAAPSSGAEAAGVTTASTSGKESEPVNRRSLRSRKVY